MSRKLTLGILIALIVGHILLAAGYSSVTPYRQSGKLLSYGGQFVLDIGAPDERQHVDYVKYLLDNGSFPVFKPGAKDLYDSYESHQPPAFYVLGALWSKVTGVSDLTKRDDGIKLRFLNCLIGGGTVAGVFFLAFWGFQKKELGLTAAAFAAFLPMNTALSGAVSNDPLLILLCTWLLALLALCLRQGWTWKRVVAIGLITGLAMLTKVTAMGLVPVLLLAIFLPGASQSSDTTEVSGARKPTLAMIGAAAVIALALAGPWWARNQKLYHEPFAIKAFNDAFKGSRQKSEHIAMIDALNPGGSSEFIYWTDYVGWWTARSFFGAFGYLDIWMNETGTSFTGTSKQGAAPNTLYRLLIAATALCLIGWIWAATQPEWKPAQSVQILNTAFLVIVVVLFIRFNMQYFQAQGRYLLPALGPIACGYAVGTTQLLSKRREFVLPAMAGLFLLLNLWAVMRLPDEFAKRVAEAPAAAASQ